MIISANPLAPKDEFDSLLSSVIIELNNQAKISINNLSQLSGNKLEPYVRDVLADMAIGTEFEGSIELIAGQKFPDIVAKKIYGVEVKTTTQNHWKTTGNSVLESSRIDNVERIYMLFAKLAAPIEFRYRPYEECLSEVVVTHSPRYLIDMNLESGNTIFNKINLTYDQLRKEENPIKPIVQYYKSKLKPGQEMWWMDQDNPKSTNVIIKFWKDLSVEAKQYYKNLARVYFPELFGNSNNKYERIAAWLITREGIICPNVRDQFSAGGREAIYILKNKKYLNVPRSLKNLFDDIDVIRYLIMDSSEQNLNEHWDKQIDNKIEDWINLVDYHCRNNPISQHLNVKAMLNDAMS